MKKKIVVLVFRLFLFFLLFEIFLKISGHVSLFVQQKENESRLKDGHVYRIICIGDSNTAVGGEDGYVPQLDTLLNERSEGISFEVLNKGLGAASSTIILKEVDAWLDEYQPDMVVAMMGTNDRVDLVKASTPTLGSKIDRLFQKFGTYRLLVRLGEKVGRPTQPTPPNPQEPKKRIQKAPDNFVKQLYHGMALKQEERWQEARDILELLVVLDLEDKAFLQRARMELADCYHTLGQMDKKVRLWSKLLKAYSYDVYATDRIQWHCRDHEGEKEIFDMLHKLVLEYPDNRAYLGLLGMCYAQYGKEDMANRYLDKYRVLNKSGNNAETRENYLKLAELLNQKSIKGVFVEYPSRSAAPLQRTFDQIKEKSNFILVDNEELFKEALDPQHYHEYFTDRNYEDIGHCTRKGNRMLAGHIAEVILDFIK